ncbi:hypothetical protein ACVWXU_000706 [Streptomyces sp. TE33382]
MLLPAPVPLDARQSLQQVGHLRRRADIELTTYVGLVVLVAPDRTGDIAFGEMDLDDDAVGGLPDRVDRRGRQRRPEGGQVMPGSQQPFGQALQGVQTHVVPAFAVHLQPLVGPARQQLPGELLDERLAVGGRRCEPVDDLPGRVAYPQQVELDQGRQPQALPDAVDQGDTAGAPGLAQRRAQVGGGPVARVVGPQPLRRRTAVDAVGPEAEVSQKPLSSKRHWHRAIAAGELEGIQQFEG